MAREKIPTRHAPFIHFQNVYTKHNITTMIYYINIYVMIGAIISVLALLITGYWVKHHDDKPLSSSDVLIIMFFWPLFLWFLFYYFFVKKDLDK